MGKNVLVKIAICVLVASLFGCSTTSLQPYLPTLPSFNQATTQSANLAYNTPLWEGDPATIWNKLQHTSTAKLISMQSATTDSTQKAWLHLALIAKQKNIATQQLVYQLVTWRQQNPTHPANRLLPSDATLTQLQSHANLKQIAVLLPQNGPYRSSGQSIRSGVINAYYANLGNMKKQNIKFYDTSKTEDMPALYQQAIADGADFIIGPLMKNHVQQLKSLRTLPVPVLALNYADSQPAANTQFYEFGLMPEDESAQLAGRARSAGLSKAIIIAPQDAWGKRLSQAFTTHWQAQGGSVQDTWYFSANTQYSQEIANLLKVNSAKILGQADHTASPAAQRRQDFDVIFLFSHPKEARIIVPLLRYYYANNVPIYATSAVYAGKPNPTKDIDLNGVVVCDIPWGVQIGKERGLQTDRLYAVGQDAYRLSQNLSRLEALPNFPVYGATGGLTLSAQNQIHRSLPCVPIRNGLI